MAKKTEPHHQTRMSILNVARMGKFSSTARSANTAKITGKLILSSIVLD